MIQGVTPSLWFDSNAEEAAQFYTSVFPNSRIGEIARYTDAGPGPEGSAMTVSFVVNGQEFIGINGGPVFQFTPAISFVINCETQDEVDYLWEALSSGGETEQCGWLRDRFGVSWQIVPTALSRLMSDPDAEKAGRVAKAMLQMTKLDIAELQRAYDGVESAV
ncbi:MAG TPA: VOC family protein [Anaerolineaceae bacterium]